MTVKCDVDANPSPEIVWFKRDCDGCRKVRPLSVNCAAIVCSKNFDIYSKMLFSDYARHKLLAMSLEIEQNYEKCPDYLDQKSLSLAHYFQGILD